MGKWEFYDENEDIESFEDQEPSFSIYDFKKWLDTHNEDIPTFKESLDLKEEEILKENKETLKEQFKQRIRSRVQNNTEKRLANKKKKN